MSSLWWWSVRNWLIHCSQYHTNYTLDDVLWIWWFDRQNIIQTTGLNFVLNLPHLACLLIAFQRFTLRDWGIEEELIDDAGNGLTRTLYQQFGPFILKFENDIAVKVYPAYLNSTGSRIQGRATCILVSQIQFPLPQSLYYDGYVAVKFAWPEIRRRLEAETTSLWKGTSMQASATTPSFSDYVVFHERYQLIPRNPTSLQTTSSSSYTSVQVPHSSLVTIARTISSCLARMFDL